MTEKEKSKPSPRKVTVLRQLRERAGLSREQLVARLDNRISLRTLQRWENLGNEPAMTRKDWLDLCEALNVRWDDLPVSLSSFVEVVHSDLIAV
ncbi:MAG: helix-turn-helix transcriptional regulator [Microcoleus sp. PH2017_10_PVI_O_A]|uniref:helix-turn-helix transcriptional regulator n=1 Tax=unclassified Microcoleus TaxID=2642155 RepID=UPI001DE82E0F|nr:helix-turn-helix transcriptional regulator [Microcoleus sp. PH2017_10_PVI_O_A]MCC3459141.1 helix-turn-helix transcriptional regulator [Microcoleus sp. PH2017_11_PCY_U_A]MCC3477198.1 helix-turn-helix transcriptional regulator [Microcoleus sp. PH2017_12_PCY_D_A]MCC3530745.1 helix-turn-helix transcriptional regulator [Microcoleus sp. PH2017_21_RUC_O_A]MCC3543109.1 helix-turn-helix transcriptional regulator [Microcoleus sp. PH2017_22_RUC_O_B]MCC3558355.1 helix-turn-helix transcriptional regulat